jgi:hypothetical protein
MLPLPMEIGFVHGAEDWAAPSRASIKNPKLIITQNNKTSNNPLFFLSMFVGLLS